MAKCKSSTPVLFVSTANWSWMIHTLRHPHVGRYGYLKAWKSTTQPVEEVKKLQNYKKKVDRRQLDLCVHGQQHSSEYQERTT
ncbi:hypothetical protein JTE90_025670 [Oedothorax gibbosus]|uniref:Uncharacterized protein n=1 Tax=Oedothorax gibbosus TaxID=931172 RepID=A0AAV6TH71_9ARAC|nr:hypothetical protein JTE90_025670 [Oedothorax gibbosus]